jgi:hypothetical protein
VKGRFCAVKVEKTAFVFLKLYICPAILPRFRDCVTRNVYDGYHEMHAGRAQILFLERNLKAASARQPRSLVSRAAFRGADRRSEQHKRWNIRLRSACVADLIILS